MFRLARFALIVLAAAAVAVWLAALLFKPPRMTALEWLRRDPLRAVWVGGAVVAVAVWWAKPLHWRDFEDRDRGDDGFEDGGLL
jgi:hypothetical protein